MSTSTPFLESSKYVQAGLRGCHSYILPDLLKLCSGLRAGSRMLDVGCGNGSIATELVKRGFKVTGIDMAEAGIRIARASCPEARFEVLPADFQLLENLGEKPFDVVYSLEVIEHLYDPRNYLAGCFAATRKGGRFICSTPYHGYLKNLALSLANAWDHHHNPLFDGAISSSSAARHFHLSSLKPASSISVFKVRAGFRIYGKRCSLPRRGPNERA